MISPCQPGHPLVLRSSAGRARCSVPLPPRHRAPAELLRLPAAAIGAEHLAEVHVVGHVLDPAATATQETVFFKWLRMEYILVYTVVNGCYWGYKGL